MSNFAKVIQNIPALLPHAPIISSAAANWSNILLVHHRLPATIVPEHCLPYHQVCIKLGKPYRLEQAIDGCIESLEVFPGEIGLYLANHNQAFSWDEEAEFLQLYVAPELLKQISEEVWNAPVDLIPQSAPFVDPLILQIGLALRSSLETESPVGQLYAYSMAHTLATHLLFRYSRRKPLAMPNQGCLSQQQLNQVINYIHDNLEQNVNLIELAGTIQLSPYHFARLFKQSIGLPPHQYQIKCRIERVKELLQLKKLTIADIAQIAGFSSQAHLNYHFKRWVGVTPKAFLCQ